MSDHSSTLLTDDDRVEEERRIARSGGLARLARACAQHPWRVVLGWVVVIVALIGLNVAFHGTLVNDFKVPGTDFQKATDLINAKFGGEKGAALRVVVAAPNGETLTTGQRQAAVSRMVQVAHDAQATLDQNPKNSRAIDNPLGSGSNNLSDSKQIAFFDAQFDRTGFELPRSKIVALENQLRAIGKPAGLQVEFTGEAESAAPTQGLSDIVGLIAAFIILIILFRAVVPTLIPIVFAIVAVVTAFLLLYLAARFTHFNTVTEILVPMIGLGVGIDYTLFIVTRFRQFLHDGLEPAEAAAAAGATAGRAVIFAGVTVAISITGLALIGIDFITKLGIGSALGVLTAVLLANSMLHGRALAARAEDRSRAPWPAAGGRVARGPAEDPRRPLGPVRHAPVRPGVHRRAARAGGDGRPGAQVPPRTGGQRHGAQAADHAQGVRPADAGLRPGLHRAHPGRRGHAWRQQRPEAALRRHEERPGRQERRQADLQRQDGGEGVGVDHQRLLRLQATGHQDGRHRLDPAEHDDPDRARELGRACLRVR
jgi:hypothetical protein